MTLAEIEAEIAKYMPVEDFLRIHERLAVLRKEEENKLQALAELQQIYLNATTDQQRDMVKNAVAEIREMSKINREELRSLNSTVHGHMDIAVGKNLYERYLKARGS